MQDGYVEMSLDQSHRLINHGPVVLVSTRNADGTYDVAPVAWNCPASKDPPMLLVMVGRGHRTWENIDRTGEFIAVVPHRSQSELVIAAGSVPGEAVAAPEKTSPAQPAGKAVKPASPEGSTVPQRRTREELERYRRELEERRRRR